MTKLGRLMPIRLTPRLNQSNGPPRRTAASVPTPTPAAVAISHREQPQRDRDRQRLLRGCR